MVPQIDFLPAAYHVQRQREHKTLWRRMMVLFFLALATLGTWQQRHLRRKLETRRDELRARSEGLQLSLTTESKGDQQLQDLDRQAQLLSLLEFRIPATRLLAAVTSSLPEFVTLNECQTDFGMLDEGTSRNAVSPVTILNKVKLLPVEADLADLKFTASRTAKLLTVTGFAPDDLAISRYLVRLKETRLFERVTLAYSGQHRVRDEMLRRFQIRLQVKNPQSILESEPLVDRRVTKRIGAEPSLPSVTSTERGLP